MIRRVSIERLELDLRGVDPVVAEAAVRLLGPALREQLAHRDGPVTAAARLDGGHVAPVSEPRALANRLARCVTQRLEER